jgi:hypothetical protein
MGEALMVNKSDLEKERRELASPWIAEMREGRNPARRGEFPEVDR